MSRKLFTMKCFSILVVVQCFDVVRCNHIFEFGTYRTDLRELKRNRVSVVEGRHEHIVKGKIADIDRVMDVRLDTIELQETINFHRLAMETSMSLSVSMSMIDPPTPPSKTPSITPANVSPINLINPPNTGGQPSHTGPPNSVGPFPSSISITSPPSVLSNPIQTHIPETSFPTLSPFETNYQPGIESNGPTEVLSLSLDPISDCLNTSTLKLGYAADEGSTPISLEIVYHTESTSNSISDFEANLVDELIRTAVFSIFGCNPLSRGKVTFNIEESANATCDPMVDAENNCFVMETSLIIGVEGYIDTYTSDKAAFDAYRALQSRMDENAYINLVPTIVSLEFVSPLPLIEPLDPDYPPDDLTAPTFRRDVDVSPWTIGFSVASVMGGFVSLLIYVRSRRSRRAQLEETTPWVSSENTDSVI